MPKGIGRPMNKGEKMMDRVRPGSGGYAKSVRDFHREKLKLNDKAPDMEGKVLTKAQKMVNDNPDFQFFKHSTKGK